MTNADTDYQDGIAAGTQHALLFDQTRTHSLHAPPRTSVSFRGGWRVGFGNVRNLLVCQDKVEAGEDDGRPAGNWSYGDQAALMAAKVEAAVARAPLCSWAECPIHHPAPAASVVVQARRNTESDDWQDVGYVTPDQVDDRNRSWGWQKFRTVTR